MRRNLQRDGKENTIARPGTKPRSITAKAVAANSPTWSRVAFTAASASLVASVVQHLIDLGALIVENGIVHARKP
jgi:hypothetical protein